MLRIGAIFILFACSVSSGFASYFLVYAPTESHHSFKLGEPFEEASLRIIRDPLEIDFQVDGERIDIDEVALLSIPDLELNSIVLAREGYNPELLYLLVDCYNEDGEETGRVTIALYDGDKTTLEVDGCGT